jgi:NAD+ diphosphatase
MLGYPCGGRKSLEFSVNPESELESARWLSRTELKVAQAENLPQDRFLLPAAASDSIARRLIEEWLGHEAGPSING